MRPTLAESEDPRALTDLTELARNSVQRPTRAELNQGLNTLCSRIAEDNFRARVRWSQIGAVALVLTLVILPVAFYLHQRALPALAYQIEGGRVIEGGYLREAGKGGMKVSFNEGSRLELTPGTRGRVLDIDREGARFAIDSGTASFRVTPSNGRQWSVEVGPFLVTVKGTVFSVSWDPPTEHFELILRQGRVLVSGPLSGGELTLRAGQRLSVSLPKAETLITENAQEEARGSTATAPALAQSIAIPAPPQPSPEKPDSSAPSTAPVPPSTNKTERRWADELANGHWDRILQKVDSEGLDISLNGASGEDLFALANAARYGRRTEVARAALLAYRRRFPHSPRAVEALFLLGRVEESRGSGMTRAIGWYDQYLTQAPAGAYAAEALGRKMTITNEVNGAASARPLAEEYLRRFPSGSYAGSARALLHVP